MFQARAYCAYTYIRTSIHPCSQPSIHPYTAVCKLKSHIVSGIRLRIEGVRCRRASDLGLHVEVLVIQRSCEPTYVPDTCGCISLNTHTSDIHTYIHTYIHTHINAYIHTYMQTCIHSPESAHTLAHEVDYRRQAEAAEQAEASIILFFFEKPLRLPYIGDLGVEGFAFHEVLQD